MLARINKNRSYLPGIMDEFFNNDFMNNFYTSRSTSTPAVNIIEQNDEFKIDVAAPGLSKGDFKIDLNDNILTISSEKKEEKNEEENKFMRREFSYSSFCRSFQLPQSVNQEAIKANHSEGILTVHLPKKEEEIKAGPKTIEIG